MAIVTYVIRMLPLVVFRKPIDNKFFKSFLFYVPYVTISVMIFPDIITCTGSSILGCIALVISAVLSYIGLSLPLTAFICCFFVYVLQFIVM